MGMIKVPPPIDRRNPRSKGLPGATRLTEVKVHPGLKDGEEPKLIRQGGRRRIVVNEAGSTASTPQVEPSAFRRAAHRLRWQSGHAK